MVDSGNEIVQEWVEHIPEPDALFMRVPVGWLSSDRQLHPGVFRENEGAISLDWSKYATANQTRYRAFRPENNGIIALVAGQVRSISGLSVDHEPLKLNRAHSGIHGLTRSGALPAEESKTMRRSMLFDLVDGWEIDPFG